jgi:carbon starvation protein CstA
MGNPAIIVNEICQTWLGKVGAILAILGVVAAPITSGDTAFRSARLIAADFLRLPQDKLWRRLILSLPIFMISGVLMVVDFDILWRYFAWFNQTLGTITLWALTVWLARHAKNCYITLIPAIFMTLITSSYILFAPEGFSLPYHLSMISACVFSGLLTLLFFRKKQNLMLQ